MITVSSARFPAKEFFSGANSLKKEYFNWRNVVSDKEPAFRIRFNGNYLLKALTAAQKSAGGFKSPVVLEFTDPLSPVIFRTNQDDIKLILPMRIGKEWKPLGFKEEAAKSQKRGYRSRRYTDES